MSIGTYFQRGLLNTFFLFSHNGYSNENDYYRDR